MEKINLREIAFNIGLLLEEVKEITITSIKDRFLIVLSGYYFEGEIYEDVYLRFAKMKSFVDITKNPYALFHHANYGNSNMIAIKCAEWLKEHIK